MPDVREWPSLFDLQDDVDEPDAFDAGDDRSRTVGGRVDGRAEVEPSEVFDPSSPSSSEQFEPESESDDEPKPARG